jgi:hypothetical protein
MHAGQQTQSLPEPSNNASGSQESELFEAFSNLALSEKTDPHWPRISLLTQKTLDACLKSAQQGSVPLAFH